MKNVNQNWWNSIFYWNWYETSAIWSLMQGTTQYMNKYMKIYNEHDLVFIFNNFLIKQMQCIYFWYHSRWSRITLYLHICIEVLLCQYLLIVYWYNRNIINQIYIKYEDAVDWVWITGGNFRVMKWSTLHSVFYIVSSGLPHN